jgi:hypothetical protein
LIDNVAEGCTAAERDDPAVAYFLEADRGSSRQVTGDAGDDDQLLGEHDPLLNSIAGGTARNVVDDQVELARLEHIEHPRGVFLAEDDVDARVFAGETAKHGREIERCQPVDGTHSNNALLEAYQLLEFGAGRFELVECSAGPVGEYFTGGGEGAAGTVDEVEADFSLESTQLLGDGWLCHMEFLGCPGEMAMPSNREQVFELAIFHVHNNILLSDLYR